jgi:hypothetical protein
MRGYVGRCFERKEAVVFFPGMFWVFLSYNKNSLKVEYVPDIEPIENFEAEETFLRGAVKRGDLEVISIDDEVVSEIILASDEDRDYFCWRDFKGILEVAA